MWKKIESFLLKKNSNTVGIDIGTGAIKVVEIGWRKGKSVLKNFGIQSLPLKVIEDGRILDSSLLSDILSKLLATNNISSRHVVIAVGGRGMFARELVFPVMTKEELQEAIKWDLEKYIPYAPESYYFDFSIVGKGDIETEIKVLLVAAPHELINSLTNIIKNADLVPVAVDVEPLALYRTFINAENAIVIDIGKMISQVTIFQNGSPAVIRNIPIGGERMTEVIMEVEDLTNAEAEQVKGQLDLINEGMTGKYAEKNQQLKLLLTEFCRDIRRTAEYYQLQNNVAIIDKMYITGGGSKMNNLITYLATQLELPVILHDPLIKLEIPSSFDKSHLQQIAPQLSTAIGLSLRGGER